MADVTVGTNRVSSKGIYFLLGLMTYMLFPGPGVNAAIPTGKGKSQSQSLNQESGLISFRPRNYTDYVSRQSVNWPRKGLISFQVVGGAGGLQKNIPVTVGEVFQRDAVGPDSHLVARIGGTEVPLQVDRKATWNDGSLKHAIITVRVPRLDAGSRSFVTLYTTDKAGNHAGSVTIRDLLSSGFNAEVSLHIKGKDYRVNARRLLEAALHKGNCKPWGRECNKWLAGPLVTEWLVGGALETPNGNVDPHLHVYFYIRAYADNAVDTKVNRARVDIVVENDWSYVKDPSNITYDATLTVGRHLYHAQQLDNYAHTRWHKVMWWGGRPRVYLRLDGKYIQATGAVSEYANVRPTNQFLSTVRTSFPPMTKGDQTTNMGATGAQPAIGPLPRWTTTYVISTDPRAFGWMLANDDAVGSYPFHYRDEATGRPLEITNHPYVTIAD
ncbi:MAG TPA: hypothetical protein VFA95_04990, partial [Gammaproteobacteria bacterium]|nr:hypothetical protein [Gammaproteobacteria bacterium]